MSHEITTYTAASEVTIKNRTAALVDLYVHEHVGSTITLTSNTTIEDVTLNVAAGHGTSAGQLVCMKEDGRYYQGTILSVTATTIVLDTPLDYAFTASGICSATSKELAVDGSATTQTFHIRPPSGAIWDITRALFLITGSGAMDSAKFGDQAALTNGVVMRKKDGAYQNIFNIKSNGDFANRAYDIAYDAKAPAGTTAVRIRRSFGGPDKNDAVIRLNGDVPEDIEFLIQDDLTGVASFNIILQGHVVSD